MQPGATPTLRPLGWRTKFLRPSKPSANDAPRSANGSPSTSRTGRFRGRRTGVCVRQRSTSGSLFVANRPSESYSGVSLLDKITSSQLPGRQRQSRAHEATFSCTSDDHAWSSSCRARGAAESGLLHSAVRARIDAAHGRMSSPHPQKRWRYMSPGASETCRRYSHEQATHNHARLVPDRGRLEVECGPFGGGRCLTAIPEQTLAEWHMGCLGAPVPLKMMRVLLR
jgi:hypothetical protein